MSNEDFSNKNSFESSSSDEFEPSKGQKAAFKRIFNDFKEQTEKDLSAIKNDVSAIRKFKAEYLDGTADKPSIKLKTDQLITQLTNKVAESNTKHAEIVGLHNELFEGTNTTDSIEDTLNELVEDAKKRTDEIGLKKKELEDFYDRVFGKQVNSKTTLEGYKQQFEKQLTDISEFLKKQEEKFITQFDQIQSLLPGATSIGLAKAFEDQKKSYEKSILTWSIVFVVTMVSMIAFGVFYIVEISKIGDLDIPKAIISILNKLPFFVPTVWLAIYSSKQQSQNKRLQQEYAFKETFAKSYDGQKTQLSKLNIGDEESDRILKQLLENLVAITSHNPSDTLEHEHHNEKMPLTQFVEKIVPNKAQSKRTVDN